MRTTVSTQFTQTNDTFNFAFNELRELINENKDSIQENKTYIEKYIRFKNGTIELGEDSESSETSPYKLRIENDRIAIYYNDNLISSWIQDTLDVSKMTIGSANNKFEWITLTNGSLSLRRVD